MHGHRATIRRRSARGLQHWGRPKRAAELAPFLGLAAAARAFDAKNGRDVPVAGGRNIFGRAVTVHRRLPDDCTAVGGRTAWEDRDIETREFARNDWRLGASRTYRSSKEDPGKRTQ